MPHADIQICCLHLKWALSAQSSRALPAADVQRVKSLFTTMTCLSNTARAFDSFVRCVRELHGIILGDEHAERDLTTVLKDLAGMGP
jgi:hypothetical protein